MQIKMTLLAGVAALALSPTAALAQESTQDPLLPPAQEQQPAEQAPMDSETIQNEAPDAQATDPAAPTDPAITDPATTQAPVDGTMGDEAIGDVVVEPAVTPPPAEALIQSQRPNEIRGENLIGATVINPEGEEVGKVKDILFDTSGTATGVVLSVGGILGVGAKDVGLNWSELDMRPEPGDVVRINYSKAQLEAAPPFQTQEALEAESQANQPADTMTPGAATTDPSAGGVTTDPSATQ